MSNLPGLYCQKSLLSVCFTVSLCTQAMFVFVPYAHPTNHPACSVMALLFSKSGLSSEHYLFCVRGPYGRSFDAFHVVAGKHPHSAVFRRSFHPIVLHVNHVEELFPCLQFQFVGVFRFKIKQGLGHWQTHRQHRFVVFHRFHVLVHVLFELGLGGHRIGFDFVKRIKTTTGTCRCWCCFVRWTTDTCRCWCCFVGWTTPSWRYKEEEEKTSQSHLVAVPNVLSSSNCQTATVFSSTTATIRRCVSLPGVGADFCGGMFCAKALPWL